MRHRDVWSEHHYKFGRVDPTPWIPLEVEKPSYIKQLWKGFLGWLYSL